MESTLLVGSPFLHDPSDFHSPASNQYDISPNPGSPFDSFDYPIDTAHFPATPSYNGSYQNSPYSVASDLPGIDGVPSDSLGLFPDSVLNIDDDYNPADFDGPSTSSGLLTFREPFLPSLDNNNPQVSVSVAISPPPFDISSPNAFDHSSPASSNGIEEDRRSHASSSSSYMHPASPRQPLDLPQNLDALRFDSPHWSAGQLPGTGIDSPPIINAPDGDGGIGHGPQLHIVPATPISGGGVTAQNVPFQTTLEQLQGGSQTSDPIGWDASRQGLNNEHQAAHYPDQSGFTFGGSNNESAAVDSRRASPRLPPSSARQQAHFLVPQMHSRSRSLSDTSSRPPVWDTLPSLNQNLHQQSHQGHSSADNDGNIVHHSHDGFGTVSGTVNMNDVLPGPSGSSPGVIASCANNNLHSPPLPSASASRHPASAGPHQTSFSQQQQGRNSPYLPPRLPHQFTFGTSNGGNPSLTSTDFLTPDSIGATQLRRAKSDSIRTHRLVRSEDLRHSTLSPGPPSNMLYPPPSSTSQDFISRQYLHPTETIPSISSHGGHHRRASSGSRERPFVGGWSSQASSNRASPYPSPSASPRPGYGPLPPAQLPEMIGMPSIGRRGMGGMDINMSGMGGMNSMNMASGISVGGGGIGINVGLGDTVVPMTVSKVNVTTPSTADASQKRRKQPANFACPVPGCGSTFTRHFNLKGHLRSHAEEKPYQCKWPGCGKGFARQHDCKRHEQLHLNIRPYPCEGCKKNFARMDALNRHLRSEGGAECRKIQEELSSSDGADGKGVSAPPAVTSSSSSAANSESGMKPDPDGNWPMGGGGIMM
ncbi:hypothetical protein ABKN59_008674 [Abortiporus biennis]